MILVLIAYVQNLAGVSSCARSIVWSEPSFISILCIHEKRGFWRDCVYAQARLSLYCSSIRLEPKSRILTHIRLSFQDVQLFVNQNYDVCNNIALKYLLKRGV